MAWVETGTPPGEIVASKVEGGTVTRTRPVFPYPAVARHASSGSTDDAVNFAITTPRTKPRVGYRWVGAPLHSSGYQATCRAENTHLVCRPSSLALGSEQP